MFLLQASTTALFDLADLKLIAPEIVLTACACVALVMDVMLPQRERRWTGYFALASTALAAASVVVLGMWAWNTSPLTGFYGTVKVDGFAIVFKLVFLLAAALTIAISLRYLDVEGEQRGEYYSLVLFGAGGVVVFTSGCRVLESSIR